MLLRLLTLSTHPLHTRSTHAPRLGTHFARAHSYFGNGRLRLIHDNGPELEENTQNKKGFFAKLFSSEEKTSTARFNLPPGEEEGAAELFCGWSKEKDKLGEFGKQWFKACDKINRDPCLFKVDGDPYNPPPIQSPAFKELLQKQLPNNPDQAWLAAWKTSDTTSRLFEIHTISTSGSTGQYVCRDKTHPSRGALVKELADPTEVRSEREKACLYY